MHGHRGHMTGVFPRLGPTMRVEFHGSLGGRNSNAADDDHRFAGHLHQQRHFAAESEAAQFGDADRQNAGNTGIHGIAALRENPVSGLHFEIVGGSHHFVQSANRRHHGRRGGILRFTGPSTE